MATLPSFSFINSTAAPLPTSYWDSALKAPYPTSAPWQNFVLNQGSSGEAVGPYLAKASNSNITICYPTKNIQSTSIVQVFIANIVFSILEGLVEHKVTRYDDLSVTISWGERLLVPLVRGSPYITFQVSNGTPIFSSEHAILNLTSNTDNTKHKVSFNNGQTWIIYSSVPLALSPKLHATSPFTGVIRIANLPDDTTNTEAVLDYYSPVYPISGIATIQHFGLVYRWQARSWSSLLETTELIMLSIRTHRQILSQTNAAHSCKVQSSTLQLHPGLLSFQSIDGPMVGVTGSVWTLRSTAVNIGWHSTNGITSVAGRAAVIAALQKDIADLARPASSSSYFFGKAVARAARLALIAEEVGLLTETQLVRDYLDATITPWYKNTFAGNGFLYDSTWGGVITVSGAKSTANDFGIGVYNDHHYHYGYFLYASAVLAKLNSTWAERYRPQVYTLVRDFMTSSRDDIYFPRLRHFDLWALHSWASGLTEFSDGRNQESTSEAVNAYYAASLVGLVYGDLALASLGATLAALEARSAQNLWHIPENSNLYSPVFVEANRIVGVLWATKRDTGLWFAPSTDLEKRTGIQVLPVTPYMEQLFSDTDYAKELVEWTVPALSRQGVTDGWRGFVWAVQAVYNITSAIKNINALKGFDDGNSLSNLLWWTYSRA